MILDYTEQFFKIKVIGFYVMLGLLALIIIVGIVFIIIDFIENKKKWLEKLWSGYS